MKLILLSRARVLAAFLMAGLFGVFSASAQQIILTGGSVIGGGPSYSGVTYNGGTYSPRRAVDEQTGAIAIETSNRDNYWLGPDGVNSSYFVLDLGAPYTLSQITLFNTQNWESLDRSTLAFHINASNSVSFVDTNRGFNLVSGATILSGTLPFPAGNPPGGTVFLASNGLNVGAAYRYISYTFDSFSNSTGVAATGNGGGLHEIHVFAIPEPSTYAALAGLAAFGIVCVRRHRDRVGRPDRAV